MSEFEFTLATRESTSAIIAVSGASGSGKTFTSLQLALGLAGENGQIALIGTEGRRALHYAPPPGHKPDFVNTFPFRHMELHEPYSPDRFLSALKLAENAGFAVIIVDSFSDEYVGAGGLVDMKESELANMRNKNDAAAWARPKAAHKLVTRWMRTCRSHLIVSLRAEEKVKIEKINGETKVVPIGWQAVCEKTVPFEMMTSIMLHPPSAEDPRSPGKPFPIKIQEQHRQFFPPDQPITREAGRRLAEWCSGAVPATTANEPDNTSDAAFLRAAEEKADEGTAALEAWWKSLSRANRQALRDELPRLKDIAIQADSDRIAASYDNPQQPESEVMMPDARSVQEDSAAYNASAPAADEAAGAAPPRDPFWSGEKLTVAPVTRRTANGVINDWQETASAIKGRLTQAVTATEIRRLMADSKRTLDGMMIADREAWSGVAAFEKARIGMFAGDMA